MVRGRTLYIPPLHRLLALTCCRSLISSITLPPPSCDAPAQMVAAFMPVPLPLAAVALAEPPSQASNSPIEIHHGGCAAPASTPQPSNKRGRETCSVNHSPRTRPRQTLSCSPPPPRQTPPPPFGSSWQLLRVLAVMRPRVAPPPLQSRRHPRLPSLLEA